MPADPKLAQLVHILKRATESKSLRWERTPDPLEFKARLPGKEAVRILREDLPPLMSGGPSGKPALVLILLDADGQLLEQWQPMDDAEWTMLEELHRIARRSALNTNETLRDLLETLSTLYPEKKA